MMRHRKLRLNNRHEANRRNISTVS